MVGKRLVEINLAFAVVFLALGMLVDGNGRILRLSEAQSAILTLAILIPAWCAAGVLIAKGDGLRRTLGIVLALLYFVLLFPIITPF